MTLEYKRKIGVRIGVGIGLEILSPILVTGGDALSFIPLIVCLVGVLFFIWGCTTYAVGKGYPHWLGCLGLLSLLGLLILFLLPERPNTKHDPAA